MKAGRFIAAYPAPWPPKADRFRVACYVGNFSASPVEYVASAVFDHRTLKAAARRLAFLIARRKPNTPRYDALYIITPEGDRLPLCAARKRIREESAL